MTSPERDLRALAHQPTDRMPADYHAFPWLIEDGVDIINPIQMIVSKHSP